MTSFNLTYDAFGDSLMLDLNWNHLFDRLLLTIVFVSNLSIQCL